MANLGLEIDWNLAPSDTAPIMIKHDLEIDWSATPADDAGDTVKIEAQAPLNPPVEVDSAVSEESEALVEQERSVAQRHGFAHDDGKLFFQAGTRLADSGLTKAREYAAEYAKLPAVADAATAHATVIAAELRKDQPIQLANWRVGPTGLFHNLQQPEITAALSDTAWSQIGNHQSEIEAQHGAALSAPRGNVNAWIGNVLGVDKARVRGPASARQIFAIVSNSKRGYTAYDSDRLLGDIAKALPGTKCKVKYDARTTRLTAHAYVQAPIDVASFIGVGRVHQAGVKLTTRDDGMGSIELDAFLVRIRCLNHTLVTEAHQIRRKHTGSFADLYRALGELIGTMPALIGELKEVWAHAAAEHYLDSATGLAMSAPAAIERLVMLGHLPTAGLSSEAATDAYVAAWRAEESPDSAAGVVMAVQRASHEFSSTDAKWRPSQWATDTEAVATSMLYQPVYTLAAPAAA